VLLNFLVTFSANDESHVISPEIRKFPSPNFRLPCYILLPVCFAGSHLDTNKLLCCLQCVLMIKWYFWRIKKYLVQTLDTQNQQRIMCYVQEEGLDAFAKNLSLISEVCLIKKKSCLEPNCFHHQINRKQFRRVMFWDEANQY